MKKQDSDLLKFINKHFHAIIYCFYYFILIFLLYQARLHTLFTFPVKGTEQYSIIDASRLILKGTFPTSEYGYSPFYTVFLSILSYISYGNLAVMRIIQIAICSFIPVYIYKLARRLRLGRENSQIAAFIYCLYGASALVLLDFSYTSLISLFFLLFAYFFHKAFMTRKWKNYIFAGLFASLCMLGRDNFIPMLVVPLVLILFPKLRKRIHYKKKAAACFVLCMVILPFVIYNVSMFGRMSLVADTPSQLILNTNGKIPPYAMVSSYERPANQFLYTYNDIVDFMIVFIVPFNLLVVLAAISFTSRKKYLSMLFVALFVITYFIVVLYSNNYYRYRAPVVPLLCVMAGGAFFAIRSMRSKFKLGLVLALIVSFTVLTYVHPDSLRSDDEKRRVADILIYIGRFEKAHFYLDKIENEGIPATDQWVSLIRKISSTGDVRWSLEVEQTFLKHLQKRAKGHLIIPKKPQ